MVALQVLGKAIELFAVHTEEEIKKKRRRRKQREKEKSEKRKNKDVENNNGVDGEVEKELDVTATDELSSKSVIRTEAKVIAFDLSSDANVKHVLVSLHNNSIVLYKRTKEAGS